MQVAESVIFVRTGIGHANAHRGAVRLQEAGANALMSFGVCGGIDPSLENGDVLLPVAVTDGLETMRVSESWRDAIKDVLDTNRSLRATQLLVDKPVACPG